MEECQLDPQEVEEAKAFWAEEDVDQVFDGVYDYLDHLKRVLKKNTATDKEFVQGLKLLEVLNSPPIEGQDATVVQVVIGSDELPPPEFSPDSSPLGPPAEELLPPLYLPHTCSKSCMPSLPSMPQCTPAFWGQNPLKVPLLSGFKRLTSVAMSSGAEPEKGGGDVLYKAPCGKSLSNHDDVMHFLLASESYDFLQVDFFTFNPQVLLDPPPLQGPLGPEQDLSRGLEATPVQILLGGAPPPIFRYRKERWPHGCFLSRSPDLFTSCCDCTDGCSQSSRCACVAMTTGERNEITQ